MPKIKTRRGAAKRFTVTGSGRIVRAMADRRHILTTMTRKRKRQLRQKTMVASADVANVRKQIPYL